MAPVKPGRFKFDPGSIAQVRKRLGLSQKKLAALLDVPANTVSRWETGATTPDADSLAAIYSVAAKHGMSTQFFRKRKKAIKVSKKHPRLLVFGDFQYLSPQSLFLSDFLPNVNASVQQELDRFFPATSYRQFKAFVQQSTVFLYGYQPTDELKKLGWRVREGTEDLSDDIISQIKSDCGQEPENTILVLLTHPGRDEYADLVRELKSKGVDVYLMAPDPWGGRFTPIPVNVETMQPWSREVTALVEAVGHEHWIKLTGQVWSGVPIQVPTERWVGNYR